MGCVTDPNTYGFRSSGTVTLCNPVVLARAVGMAARIRFTVQVAGMTDFNVGGGAIVGVLTEVNSSGVPYVVDLLGPIQAEPGSFGLTIAPGIAVPFTLSSVHALPTSLAGKDIHAAIWVNNYTTFRIGDVFTPNPTLMLRTDFVVTQPVGSPAFALSLAGLPGTVQTGTRPSASILVQNNGTATGSDTVSGVLTTSRGVQAGAFSSASTGSLAPGASRTVTLTLEAAIAESYAGQTLTATFADGHGSVVHASLTVTSSSSGGGGGGGGGGSGGGSGTPPPKSTTAVASTPLLIALGVAAVGLGGVWLASRE